MPKVSIVIPSHDSPQTASFLARLFKSISEQTFTDYEIVLVKEGLVGHNLNAGLLKAKGELIKIMCQDDWFAHPDALKDIVDNFTGNWMITGCHNNEHPYWTPNVLEGYNKLGGLSVITMRNNLGVFFDARLLWLIDVEFYHRMEKKFGLPTILDSVNVNIGLGDHQTTNKLTEEEKLSEHKLMNEKYA